MNAVTVATCSPHAAEEVVVSFSIRSCEKNSSSGVTYLTERVLRDAVQVQDREVAANFGLLGNMCAHLSAGCLPGQERLKGQCTQITRHTV